MIAGLAVRAITALAGAAGFSLSPFAAGAIMMAIVSIGVGGGLTWFGIHQFNKGVAQERAKCQADKVQSQLNAANEDLQAARNANAFGRAEVSRLEGEYAAEQKRSEEYAERIKKLGLVCGLTDDDVGSVYGRPGQVRGTAPRTPSKGSRSIFSR